MRRHLVTSVLMSAVTLVLFGLGYPLIVTAIAQAVFPERANGQLVVRGGAVVGSRIIGQPFASPGYFRGRLSAAGAGYDASASGGSNLGPTNKALIERVASDTRKLQAENPDAAIPVDLVTTSGSGLDPHISVAGARFQIPRVARERAIAEEELARLVDAHIEGRTWGFLGEPVVNVLMLNLALDDRAKHDP